MRPVQSDTPSIEGVSPPTEADTTHPPLEDLAAADDATLLAWTLWRRAGELRREALAARDRASRGAGVDAIDRARTCEAMAARLLRLAGCPGSAIG